MTKASSALPGLLLLALTLLMPGCGSDAAPEPPGRASRAGTAADDDATTQRTSQRERAASNDALPAAASEEDLSSTDARLAHVDQRRQAKRFQATPQLSVASREAFKHSVLPRLSRSMAGLQRHPVGDSAHAVDVNDRFKHVVVQVRGDDGRMYTECIEHGLRLNHLLALEGTP